MDLTERRVSSETIFEGIIVRVTVDQARLPDGKLATREVVYHPGGVAILPLDEDNNVTLVRQYRYPIGQLLLELPAGKLDSKAEDRLQAAKRELEEETGLRAKEWVKLADMAAAAAYTDEIVSIYLARGLEKGENVLKWLGDVERIYRTHRGYSEILCQVARTVNAHLIDVRGAFERAGDSLRRLCVDGIHPNAEGHALIGQALTEYALAHGF